MKKLITLVSILSTVAGCGYTSVDNQVTGQFKRLHHQTPIVCPVRDDADMSLGVMRNGIGSMSTQDISLNVPPGLVEQVKRAIEAGSIVKVTYDDLRFTWCQETYTIKTIEVVQ